MLIAKLSHVIAICAHRGAAFFVKVRGGEAFKLLICPFY